MTTMFRYVDWVGVAVGAVAVIISQLLGTWLFSMLPIQVTGAGYEILFSLGVGGIAYVVYCLAQGFRMTVFQLLIFSVLLAVVKSLVIASGFLGGTEVSYVVLGISGAITSLLFGLIFGNFLTSKGHLEFRTAYSKRGMKRRGRYSKTP